MTVAIPMITGFDGKDLPVLNEALRKAKDTLRQRIASQIESSLPTGCIIIWSGAVADIPIGFTICDGTSGTPDLTNNFVVGAGSTYNAGDTGGETSHTHTGSTSGDGNHRHAVPANNFQNSGSTYQIDTTAFTDYNTHSHASASIDAAVAALPAYYALCYIMRIG